MSNNQEQCIEKKLVTELECKTNTKDTVTTNVDDTCDLAKKMKSTSITKNNGNCAIDTIQQQEQEITNNNNHNDNRTNIIIGKTRVQDSLGYVGTVVYIGTVASASKKNCNTIYAGIVWDDPSRGIHDGSVICRTTNTIVRHFYTYPTSNNNNNNMNSFSNYNYTTSGSFIKLSLLNYGIVLTPNIVIQQKYVPINSAECIAPNNVFPNHTACTTSGKNNKPIEFYGEYKIRYYQQVSNLPSISLRRYGLYDVDTISNWSNFCHIQELDLAGNLFCSWKPILHILHIFPNLIKFSIACNRIGDIDMDDIDIDIDDDNSNKNDSSYKLITFPNILHFNLNETYIRKLSTLLFIGRMVPNLQELIIANNTNYNVNNNINNTFSTSATKTTTTTTTTTTTNDDDSCIHNQGSKPTTFNDAKQKLQQQQQQKENTLVQDFATAFSNLLYLDASNCCSTTITTSNDADDDDNANNDESCNNNDLMMNNDDSVNCANNQKQEQLDNSSLFQSTIQMITVWSQLPKLNFINFDDNPIQNFIHWNSQNNYHITNIDEQTTESTTTTATTIAAATATIAPDISSKSNGIISPTQFYPNVQHIQICGTLINDWSQIDILHTIIPSIRSLRFRNCPLLQGGGTGKTTGGGYSNDNANRCLIISHLPYLHTLNGTIITEMEQREAARWCVRNYNTKKLQQQQEQQQKEQQQQTLSSTVVASSDNPKHHPQYDYWITKYPEMIGRTIASGISTSSSDHVLLSDSIINVTIRSMIPTSCTMEPILRRLPYHLTIRRLKALCSRQFGPIDIDLIELTYRIAQNNVNTGTTVNISNSTTNWSLPICIENNDDTITLEQIGIPVDGAEILVHEINIHDLNRHQEQLRQKKHSDEQELINVIQQKELYAINFQRRQHGENLTKLIPKSIS